MYIMSGLAQIFALSPKKVNGSNRKIINTREEQILLPQGASKVLQNRGQVLAQPFNPVKYGGKQIGKGAYGVVYSLKTLPAVVEKLQNLLQHGKYRVGSTMPRVGDTVVIKIAKPQGKTFFEDSIKENIVHQKLSSSSGSIVCGKPVRASVPGFYFSAYDGVNYITVMSMARGMDARKYITKYRPSARGYVKLEKAIASMWLAGYLHGDFHTGNWLADEYGNVEILDFGFAVVLPQALKDKLSSTIQSAIQSGAKSLSTLGTPLGVEAYSNRIMSTRGYTDWKHSDFRALAAEYNRLSAKEKLLVPELRRQYWGCPKKINIPLGGKMYQSPQNTGRNRGAMRQTSQQNPMLRQAQRDISQSQGIGSRSIGSHNIGSHNIGSHAIGSHNIGSRNIGSVSILSGNSSKPVSFAPATFQSIEDDMKTRKLSPNVSRMRRFRQLFAGKGNKIPYNPKPQSKIVNLLKTRRNDTAKKASRELRRASNEKSKRNEAVKQASRELRRASNEKSKRNEAMKQASREKSKRNEAVKQASREKSKRNDTARRASQIARKIGVKRNDTMKRFEAEKLRRNASRKEAERRAASKRATRRMSQPLKDTRTNSQVIRQRKEFAEMKARLPRTSSRTSPSAPPLTQSQYIKMMKNGKSNPRKSNLRPQSSRSLAPKDTRTHSQRLREMREQSAKLTNQRPTGSPMTTEKYMEMARHTARFQYRTPRTRKPHVRL